MEFWFWVIIFFSIIIGAVWIQTAYTNNKKQEMESSLVSRNDFNASQKFMGVDGRSGIAIDEAKKIICLITNINSSVHQRIISYTDIISVELFEDGNSITKTSRTSQAGGLLVGGLLLGGVGAIVGGLSGKTKTTEKIQKIDLRLIVNDVSQPLHDIAFMNVEGNKGGIIHNFALQNARHWHGVIEVLIKEADGEELKKTIPDHSTASSKNNISVADELKKLAELKNSGLLTSDEFESEKLKLLNLVR